MGPVHDNFIPWLQKHLLRTGQLDKMLRELRHSKRSRELSAVLMECLVCGENHNVLNTVFSLCMLGCVAKLQDTAMSLRHCSHGPLFLLR